MKDEPPENIEPPKNIIIHMPKSPIIQPIIPIVDTPGDPFRVQPD